MAVRKVSRVATNLSSHILTNVKKVFGLGITASHWFFISSGSTFYVAMPGVIPYLSNTLSRHCFFIQYILLAILAAPGKISVLPAHSFR